VWQPASVREHCGISSGPESGAWEKGEKEGPIRNGTLTATAFLGESGEGHNVVKKKSEGGEGSLRGKGPG